MNSVSKTRLQLLAVFGALIIVGGTVALLFRNGAPAKAKEQKNNDQTTQQAAKPVVPTYRYFKPSTNPSFGRPLDFTGAVIGDTSALPGCSNARAGILVDLNTRKVLWAKDPHKIVPIASMTKMMTALLAFENLEHRKDISLDTPVKVSASAAKIGGSQVYLDPREEFPLGELIKAVAIKSANDAAMLTAEFVSGNSGSFVTAMNARAKMLGMRGTTFVNACGLSDTSDRDSVSTPADMVILAEHLTQYPKLMEWSATRSSTFRTGQPKQMDLRNTNHLLADNGVYGFKTGYIRKSGFCVTAGCKRGDKDLVAVVMGHPSGKDRDQFVRNLFAWGNGDQVKAANPAKTNRKTTKKQKNK